MISEIVWRRMLYVCIGLISAVAAILVMVVISSSAMAEKAVIVTSVIAFIHLLITVALIWTIKVNKHGGRINKELLVAAGVIPIVLSLLILDGAFANIDKFGMHGVGISFFICVGCDIVAGVLALIARYFRRPKPIQSK